MIPCEKPFSSEKGGYYKEASFSLMAFLYCSKVDWLTWKLCLHSSQTICLRPLLAKRKNAQMSAKMIASGIPMIVTAQKKVSARRLLSKDDSLTLFPPH
jgi:hypothetical protein